MANTQQSRLTSFDLAVLLVFETGKLYTIHEVKARFRLIYPPSMIAFFTRLFGMSPGSVVRSVGNLYNNNCLRALSHKPGSMKYQITAMGEALRNE